MLRRFHFRLCVVVAVLGLILSSLAADAQQNNSKRGRKYKPPPPTARIEVTVVRDSTGKPIENAAVIFHAMEGERDKGYMELKTNEDGKTIIDVMPIGDTVRLQIIAKGFQTFGDDYKIDKAKMAVNIRMKRPGEQYSIYNNHPETSQGGKSPDAAKPANPAKDTAPPADKPTGSASQPGAQSGQSQPQPK
jgi:5-hydroxyisourate hydrolase-like protein (transthyretin family)